MADKSVQDRLKNQPPYNQPDTSSEEEETEEVEEEQEEAPEEEEQEEKETEEKEAPEDKKEEKEEELPDETKERTKKEFEKLKKSNKELKEKTDKYQNVLESLRPDSSQQPPQGYQQPIQQPPSAQHFSHLDQRQISNTFQGMVDDKGYVDGNKLMEMLKNLNERAVRAERQAQAARQEAARAKVETQRDIEESQTVREVHSEYPELDPKSDEFNEEYYDAVRNEMIGQLMSGKKEDFKAAAEKWHDRMIGEKEEPKEETKEEPKETKEEGKEDEVATKKEKEQAEKKKQQKKDINATQPSSSSMEGYWKEAELEKLKEETRKGTKGSLAERLKRSGHGPS